MEAQKPQDPPSAEEFTNLERTCLFTSFVRWHGSAGGRKPCTWPDGTPWYTDPLGPLFVAALSPAQQQEVEETWLKGDSWLRLFCAVRTAEIDHQIQQALQQAGVQQMVLLGAGMDTRAWRLQWPPGFTVFEVDTQQVLDFKHRIILSSSSSTDSQQDPQQQQQQQAGERQLPPLSCARRVAVAADASKAQELWSRLLAAGFVAATPTVYVLEGFIGYLEKEAGNALLALLATSSSAGSRIIMTAPPTPAENALGHEVAAEAAAGAGGSGSSASNGEASKDPRVKLHHSTFEEPTETLARLRAAGWSNCVLVTSAELESKYGVPRGQPILLGRVA